MKIGVTGHQRLADPSAWAWVEEAMDRELARVGPPWVAVTSLAVGADQVLARLVLRRGGGIYAVIPFEGYERNFQGDSLRQYEELLKGATVEIVSGGGTEEDAYLRAGKRVVELSHQIISVWDGKPAKGKGGTGDIVAFAASVGVPLLHLNPNDFTVSWRVRT